MKISPDGIAFIIKEEGCVLHAYRDVVGVLTIGVGSTGPHVKEGMTITKDQAIALLQQDLARFEAAVNKAIKTKLTQNQFDALCSLSFNIGPTAFTGSSLVRLLNAGERSPQLIANKFGLWVKAGGKTLPGLVGRRRREAALFNQG